MDAIKADLAKFKGLKRGSKTIITDKYLNQYEEVFTNGEYQRVLIGNKKTAGTLSQKEREYYIDEEPVQILERLYIGSGDAAKNLANLKKHQITHIVNVATSIGTPFPTDFTYIAKEFADLPSAPLIDYLDELVDFMNTHRSAGQTVFVHCNQGVSRSASVIIAYLMKYENKSYSEAFQLTFNARPKIQPNYGFVQQLQDYETRLRASSSQQQPQQQSIDEPKQQI